eukprot:m.44754 g.44754  ORF g.44754 m.44754 type:complete len:470 (-) comp10849_c0_seq9:2817-4226(-)
MSGKMQRSHKKSPRVSHRTLNESHHQHPYAPSAGELGTNVVVLVDVGHRSKAVRTKQARAILLNFEQSQQADDTAFIDVSSKSKLPRFASRLALAQAILVVTLELIVLNLHKAEEMHLHTQGTCVLLIALEITTALLTLPRPMGNNIASLGALLLLAFLLDVFAVLELYQEYILCNGTHVHSTRNAERSISIVVFVVLVLYTILVSTFVLKTLRRFGHTLYEQVGAEFQYFAGYYKFKGLIVSLGISTVLNSAFLMISILMLFRGGSGASIILTILLPINILLFAFMLKPSAIRIHVRVMFVAMAFEIAALIYSMVYFQQRLCTFCPPTSINSGPTTLFVYFLVLSCILFAFSTISLGVYGYHIFTALPSEEQPDWEASEGDSTSIGVAVEKHPSVASIPPEYRDRANISRPGTARSQHKPSIDKQLATPMGIERVQGFKSKSMKAPRGSYDLTTRSLSASVHGHGYGL